MYATWIIYAWQQRKLGEVAEFNPKAELPEYFEYVDLESVSGTELLSYRKESKETAPSRAQRVAKKGDVFYQTVRPYQKNNYLFNINGDNFVFSTGYAQLRPKYSSEFLLARLQEERFVREVLDNSTGTSYPAINSGDLARVSIRIPIQPEQTKIGHFFQLLDQLITLQKRKVELMKELKKGWLQQIFNQEVRFDGFTQDWEEKRLGDVVKITMGQSPDSKNYTSNPRDSILVQGNADMKNGRVLPRIWTTQITKQAEKGDLILSVRAPVGDIGKTDYNVVLGRGVAGIKGNEFIFQLLGKMNQNGFWTKISTGSTFESINSNDIKNAEILLPILHEQTLIGSFFQNLDIQIASADNKLSSLSNLKKAYLEKMFV